MADPKATQADISGKSARPEFEADPDAADPADETTAASGAQVDVGVTDEAKGLPTSERHKTEAASGHHPRPKE